MSSSEFKITSYNDPDASSKTSDSSKVKPKQPTRDFNEVVDQLDEKKYKEEELLGKKKGIVKKTTKHLPKHKFIADTEEKKNTLSVFDLAGGKKQPLDNEPDAQDHQEEKPPKEEKEEMVVMTASPYKELPREVPIHVKNSDSEEPFQTKNDLHFLPEQPDLVAVNSMWMEPKQIISSNALSEPTPVAPVQKPLQELIDSITKEVYIMESKGQTDTVVKLNTDLFPNVNLRLTEFTTATGQINISFDNLTQAAEKILQLNKVVLIDILQKHDIVVQRFDTATIDLTPRVDMGHDFEKRGQGQRQEQQKGDKPK